MAQRDPKRLAEFLHAEVGDELRNVIPYDENTFELVYTRDDVEAQYTESDLDDVRQDLGIASFGKPVLEASEDIAGRSATNLSTRVKSVSISAKWCSKCSMLVFLVLAHSLYSRVPLCGSTIPFSSLPQPSPSGATNLPRLA